MDFIQELRWRGLLKNVSPGLKDALKNGKIKGYIGYDPTASSLTIGNMVTIMLLKHLQLHGHTPIILMGGATGKIGDPSGKDKERKLLSDETIRDNIKKQKKQFKKFLDFKGDNAAVIVNNDVFYKGMDVFSLLRDIGKNITVNYMMAKDSVKKRIKNKNQGISFTEFSYQLIQGYDFQYLYENENCILQMGGSDQWGNITTGTHLISKNNGKGFGLTCPLLTKSDGKKFGKSETGNIWLDKNKTTPFHFYQFWMNNITNKDISKMFKIFSLKPRREIEILLKKHLSNNPKFLLETLAEELTIRVHSKKAYNSIKRATNIIFNKKKLKLNSLQKLYPSDFDTLIHALDSFYVDNFLLNKGIPVDKLLKQSHPSLDSTSKIRSSIKGKALAINTRKINTHLEIINSTDLIHNKIIFVQNGKKTTFLGIPYATTEQDEMVLNAYYEQHKVKEKVEAGDDIPDVKLDPSLELATTNLVEKGYLEANDLGTNNLSIKGLLFCTTKFGA